MPDINQLLDDVARYQRHIQTLEKQLADALQGRSVEAQEIDSSTIMLEGIVSHRTGEARVVIRWGLQVAQLSPPEARAHALSILECADSAESDAFLVHFLKTKVKLPAEGYGSILMEFREYREQRKQEKEKEADDHI